MPNAPLIGRGDEPAGSASESNRLRHLYVLGLNHTTASLELRSRVALRSEDVGYIVQRLRSVGAREVLPVSTCNRTEFYFVSEQPEQVIDCLAEFWGLNRNDLDASSYLLRSSTAIAHLFTVASGLDSAALGESEILGQLRAAFRVAEGGSQLDKTLKPAFQACFRVGKRARSESQLGRRGRSLAAIAIRKASHLAQGLDGKTITVIGAGQLAESVVKNLSHFDPGQATICNRSIDKAKILAQSAGFDFAALDELDELIARSDLIVGAAAVQSPVINQTRLQLLKKGAVALDLGVPRNFAPELKSMGNIFALDLDDLAESLAQSTVHIAKDMEKARRIVDEETQKYLADAEQREISGCIEALVRRSEDVRRHNLDWALSQLPTEMVRERKLLEDLSIRLTRGMISHPIQNLKLDFKDPVERSVLERFFMAEA